MVTPPGQATPPTARTLPPKREISRVERAAKLPAAPITRTACCGAGDGIGRALTSLGAMRQEDIWDHEAAQRHDTPGTGMLAARGPRAGVDRLPQLASDGRALEYRHRPRRYPLARPGVPGAGIELSGPMIEQLRTKAGGTGIPVIAGDALGRGRS